MYELNEWTHLAVTIAEDTFEVYVNGQKKEGTFTRGAAQLPPDVGANLRIGSWNHTEGREWSGCLDDIRIYNQSLTENDIAGLIIQSNAGLVSHWKLDEENWDGQAEEVVDSSVPGNPGTAENGAQTAETGKIGRAGEFDGDDDSLHMGSIEVGHPLQLSNGGTITAWFKQLEGDGGQRILDKSNGLGGANGYALIAHPGDQSVLLAVGNSTYRTNPGMYELNEWTHLAVTIAKDTFEVYVNGQKKEGTFTRGAAQLPPDVGANLRIGSWNHTDGREWSGCLDDIRIYNQSLTENDIADLIIQSNAGLVSHWKLDEENWDGQEEEVVDSSVPGNPGTAENGAQTTETGKIGRAGEFDGNDDSLHMGSIEVGHPLQLSNGGTITAWFKQLEGDGGQRIIDKSDGPGGANGYALIAHPGDQSVLLAVGNSTYRTNPGMYELNEWTHLAVTIAEDTFEVYVNGRKKEGTFTRGAAQLPPDVGANLRIGSWNHTEGREWSGSLDDIRIYNQSLTENDIAGLIIQSNAGLVSHWKLDEENWDGQAEEVVDSSAPGNPGTAKHGAQTAETGKIGRAGEFDGDDDSLHMGSIEVGHPLQLRNGGTITAWFKQLEGDGGQRIIDKSDGPGGANGYALIAHPGDQSVLLAVGNSTYRTNPGMYELNEWTHLAVTIAEDTFEVYVNGQKKEGSFTRGTAQLPPDVQANLRIGSWNHSDRREWKGCLDDLRIYNQSLDQKDIVTLIIEANSGLISH